MARVMFGILGPAQIIADDTMVGIGSPMIRAVLAVLLLADGRAVSSAGIAAGLWLRPPASAASNLRTHVSRLRAILGSAHPFLAGRLSVVRDRGGYLLGVRDARTDAHEFAALARTGRDQLRRGDYPGAEASLAQACKLWRGPTSALVPDTVTGTIVPRLRSLDERLLIAREDLVQARLGLGDTATAIGELADLTARHPLRERPWAQLIAARYRCGDTAGALNTYQAARSVFAGRLGVDPGPHLTGLHAAVLRRDEAAVEEVLRSAVR